MLHDFGELKQEWSAKEGRKVEVWKSPKFNEGVEKAISLIEEGKYGLTDADFWILKTFTKNKCVYAGLIISHNGCLKVNDALPSELKFIPSKVSWVREGVGDLVMAYICDEQGIYEFGEASAKNCQNAYPFAMVLKRLMDRVILKNSKIAFSGIMSEVESDEFRQPEKSAETEKPADNLITKEQIAELVALGCDLKKVAAAYRVEDISEMTQEQAERAIDIKKGQAK